MLFAKALRDESICPRRRSPLAVVRLKRTGPTPLPPTQYRSKIQTTLLATKMSKQQNVRPNPKLRCRLRCSSLFFDIAKYCAEHKFVEVFTVTLRGSPGAPLYRPAAAEDFTMIALASTSTNTIPSHVFRLPFFGVLRTQGAANDSRRGTKANFVQNLGG